MQEERKGKEGGKPVDTKQTPGRETGNKEEQRTGVGQPAQPGGGGQGTQKGSR